MSMWPISVLRHFCDVIFYNTIEMCPWRDWYNVSNIFVICNDFSQELQLANSSAQVQVLSVDFHSTFIKFSLLIKRKARLYTT